MKLITVNKELTHELDELNFPFEKEEKSGNLNTPTQAEVCQWLREKYGLFIVIDFIIDDEGNIIWEHEVASLNSGDSWFFSKRFSSYEEAELRGIEKAVELKKTAPK